MGVDSNSIVDEWQSQGFGTGLIQTILADAARLGAAVELRVLKSNPAKRLYERSGFVTIAESHDSFVMRHG